MARVCVRDLIVLGPGTRNTLPRLRPGAVAERVIIKAHQHQHMLSMKVLAALWLAWSEGCGPPVAHVEETGPAHRLQGRREVAQGSGRPEAWTGGRQCAGGWVTDSWTVDSGQWTLEARISSFNFGTHAHVP